MSKSGKLVLSLFLILYFTAIIIFKNSSSQGTAKEFVLNGSTIFSFTFHSNISIFTLLSIAFFSFDRFILLIFKKQIVGGMLLFCFFLFSIVLPGHFIVTQCDGSEMREYLFTCELKKIEITDSWISNQISGGYEKKYHYNQSYPCFRYCDSFFIRQYQVGKNKKFNVFNGIGPFFNFDDEDFYKN